MAFRATITVIRAEVDAKYVSPSASIDNVNAEAIAFVNADSKNKWLYDTYALGDVNVLLINKNLSETIPLGEDFGWEYNKPKVETLALVESFVKALTYNKSFNDAFTLDDVSQIDKDFYGNKANVAFIIDIIGLSHTKILTDSYTVADVVNIVVDYLRPYSDSYSVTDDSRFTFVKNVEDAITLDDTSLINKDFSNQSQNSLGFTDLLGSDFGKTLTDNVSQLDEVSILHGLNKSDSTTLSDTYKTTLNKAISDAFTLDDSALVDKDYFGNKGNVFSFNDVLNYDVNKELTDGIALVELVGFVLNHPVEDSYTVSDTNTLQTDLGRTETISISESYIREIIKNLTDGLALDDTTQVNKDVDATKGNIITFGDVIDIVMKKLLDFSDSYSISDASTFGVDKGISESLVFSELVDIATHYNKTLLDTFVLDDSALVDKDFYGNKGNVVGLSEVVSQALNKKITDSTSVADIYDVFMTKVHVDSISFNDISIWSIHKNLSDTLSLTDANVVDHVLGSQCALNTMLLNNFLLNCGEGESQNISDSSTLRDEIGLQLEKTFTDSLALDDSALVNKEFYGNKGNTVGVTDVVSVKLVNNLLGQRPLNTMSLN
jgi:hypothetical protein